MELIEHAAFLNGFMFIDYFVLSTINLHCMGDLAKYWVDRIEWLGYATHMSQLTTIYSYTCMTIIARLCAILLVQYMYVDSTSVYLYGFYPIIRFA